MDIRIFGNDKRLRFLRDYIERNGNDFSELRRIYILPVPTSRDGVNITGCDITLSSVLDGVLPGECVICYGLPAAMRAELALRDVYVVDLEASEEYQLHMAYLTAMGTANYILDSFELAPCDLRVGIIGYGRIGRCLTSLMLGLGAEVALFTSRTDIRRNRGLTVHSYSNITDDAGECNVLINTAPTRLIDESFCSSPSAPMLIELAGGDNIPACVDCHRLMSLPGVAFPHSAGIRMGECVKEIYSKQRR